MKRFYVLYGTLYISYFLFTNICFAQIKTVLPNVEINALTHDFGTIPKNQEVEFVFELTNKTDAPQLIDNVRTTCGCTAAAWQQAPILPNTISKIPISFDAHSSGFFEKKIKVYLHAFRKPIVLTITGEVE
jgi:Protein of unknown function (DUF1573)